MATKNDQLNELHRKNMEAAMRLAQLSIDNSQRIMALQTELAKDLFEKSVENARAQTTAKDPGALMSLRARYAQDTAQRMMQTAQQIAAIGAEARGEFSRLLTEQLASGSRDLTDAFQSFFKSLPGGGGNAMDVFEKAMANANTAFDQIAKASSSAFEGMNEMARKATSPRAKK